MEKSLNEMYTEYREILRDFQDLLRGDFRRPRRPEPPLKRRPRFVQERGVEVTSAVDGGAPSPGTGGDEGSLLEALAKEVESCRLCPLAEGRIRAVPGAGSSRPLVLVIGEGPGAEEDRQGIPFVGPAGRYLDKWLAAIGMGRETQVFITNVVKCRPPRNRDPRPEETLACAPYLDRQREILRPRAILALGRVAAQTLLGESRGIGALRGQIHQWQGIPLIATYHPSAVLRDPSYRAPVWEDLKKLKELVAS